jgi:DNA-binding XRE family transcriptional regulator
MGRRRRIIKPPKVVKVKPISQYSRIDSEGREARNSFEALRRSLNLTQESFAEKLGLSKQLVQYYETDRSVPTLKTWRKMKENALLHNILLSDGIIEAFMQKKLGKKKEMLERRFEKKVEQLNESIQTKLDILNEQFKTKIDGLNDQLNQYKES